jgi:hypothetical protein
MDRTIGIWSCTEGTQLAIYVTCGFEKQVSTSGDDKWLQTDRGTVILLYKDLVLCGIPSTSFSPLHLDAGRITWNWKRLLWLPSEYRTGSFATYNNILTVGYLSGHVAFMTFERFFFPQDCQLSPVADFSSSLGHSAARWIPIVQPVASRFDLCPPLR